MLGRGDMMRFSHTVFSLVLALGVLAAPLAQAQPAGKVYRIGWLSPTTSLAGASELEALRAGLRELGYIEGRNITIEPRWAEGEPAALLALARALVELNVDVICPSGTQASLAAKQATTMIPIVFAAAVFPDETGLVASYARPGANVTGVAFIGPEYVKRLELLRQVSPQLTRVALLYNDHNPASIRALKETREGAERLGVVLEPYGIHRKEDVEPVFAAIARNPPGGLMTTADPLVTSYRKEIVEFAAQHRLLAMYPNRNFVQLGGLMFYGTSTTDMYHRTATYVDKILKGAKPADLPVEQPMKFDLVINLKTAAALGLTIPPLLIFQADEVIN
jgi:putative ABC transport system substrate-binding protein